MAEPLESIRAYFRAFATLEPAAVVPYYHQPTLLLSPPALTVLATAEQIEGVFIQLMTDLRRRGYARTEFASLVERRLSATLALVSAVAAWQKADGTELRRFGITYTLVRSDDAWKIAVAAVHDPEGALPPG